MCRTVLAVLSLICGTAAVRAVTPNALRGVLTQPEKPQEIRWSSGMAVAMGGGLAAVGYSQEVHAGGVNSVSVFDQSTGALLHVLGSPRENPHSAFGRSVAVSGTRIAVGEPSDANGSNEMGAVHVFDLASGNPRKPVLSIQNPAMVSRGEFGAAVALSGNRLIVGAPANRNSEGDGGVAYVFDLAGADPGTAVRILEAPDTEGPDGFGAALAVEDGMLVVGSPAAIGTTGSNGAVHVFDLDGAAPEQPVRSLTHPQAAGAANFGIAVAISGRRIVAGSWWVTGEPAGERATVFDLDSANPMEPVARLAAPDLEFGFSFACAVAISGDDVVIGGGYPGIGTGFPGGLWAFDLTEGAYPLAEAVSNPAPAGSENLGMAVAMADGQILAAALLTDPADSLAGSAYLFSMPAAASRPLRNGMPAGDERLGEAVAISGSRVVVGMPHGDGRAPYAGLVLIFDLAGATPHVPILTLENPTPEYSDRFGNAVAISGNLVAVGAREDKTGYDFAGAVYVFDLAAPTPGTPVHVLTAPVHPISGRDYYFGHAVAIDGKKLVVSSYRDYQRFYGPGYAYVYDLEHAQPDQPRMRLDDGAFGESFGTSVAISGDVAVIGAPAAGSGSTSRGRVMVYDLSRPNADVPLMTLVAPSGSGSQFGCAVDTDGSRLVVGAPNWSFGSYAYIYDLYSTSPSLSLKNPSVGDGSNGFGRAVAIDGERIAVGAYWDDRPLLNEGCVFLYDSSSTPAVLEAPSPDTQDQFGFSVAMDGDSLVAGAPGWNGSSYDRGRVMVFGPEPGSADGLYDDWTQTGGLEGAAADEDAMPWQDGVPNLLKYAFNLDPRRADTRVFEVASPERGLPFSTVHETAAGKVIQLRFPRRKNCGLVYTPRFSGSLSPGSFLPMRGALTVTPINAEWESVLVEEPCGTAERCFGRVEVTLP